MEVIKIRERAEDTMNGVERVFMLLHTWNSLLLRPLDRGRGWGQPDPAYIEQQCQMTLLKRTAVLSKTSTWFFLNLHSSFAGWSLKLNPLAAPA